MINKGQQMGEKDKQKQSFMQEGVWRQIFLYWWIALIAFWLLMPRINNEIPYSEFLSNLKAGRVSEVTVKEQEIQGKLRGKDGKQDQPFFTIPVDQSVAEPLQDAGIKFKAEPHQGFWQVIATIIFPILLIVAVLSFITSRMSGDQGLGGSGGLLSVGRSRARIYMEKEIKVSFDDVAGVEEAKEELREIVTFLTEPERYQRLGGKLPKGILLVGPPGTGKTLLARAVAGEAGVPFFSISGSEFVELFVGVGAARVRDLFERAKSNAPCIIFIDELDALGRARGAGPVTGGHDEKEQTLNQLLSELDGFDSTQGVILLSATNRPEILDPALLRAGRFDRQVLVDRPDKQGRLSILEIHMQGVTVDQDVDSREIATMTSGFTGADLANLVNEATLLAARRNASAVSHKDFNDAIERIIAGLEKKNRILNERERRVVAFHEMGHALVSMSLPGSEPVQKVSIIPRGIGALGYTMQRPTEDRFLMSRCELENKMAVLMGGRAAETLIFGELSTGAADDFVKATDIARNMVTRYGMSDALGMVSYEQDSSPFLSQGQSSYRASQFSEKTAYDIDCAVRELVSKAFDRAVAVLNEQLEVLERGATELLARETLTEPDLQRIAGTRETAPREGIADSSSESLQLL